MTTRGEPPASSCFPGRERVEREYLGRVQGYFTSLSPIPPSFPDAGLTGVSTPPSRCPPVLPLINGSFRLHGRGTRTGNGSGEYCSHCSGSRTGSRTRKYYASCLHVLETALFHPCACVLIILQ